MRALRFTIKKHDRSWERDDLLPLPPLFSGGVGCWFLHIGDQFSGEHGQFIRLPGIFASLYISDCFLRRRQDYMIL